jgi:chromosome partitioning protein
LRRLTFNSQTLAVDLDQQGNLSAALGVDLNELKFTVHWLLINDEADISSCLIEPRLRLRLLPNTLDIQADDLLEAVKVNRELKLRKKLRPVLREFDIVVIDTPPAMRQYLFCGRHDRNSSRLRQLCLAWSDAASPGHCRHS